MANPTYVFTKAASYYSPAHGGIRDFVEGEQVTPEAVIADASVVRQFIHEGVLRPLAPVVAPEVAKPAEAPKAPEAVKPVEAPPAAAPVEPAVKPAAPVEAPKAPEPTPVAPDTAEKQTNKSRKADKPVDLNAAAEPTGKPVA